MLQTNKLKIMEAFFEEPSRNFHLRELSRITGIAVTSTKKYLEELEKEGLIKKDTKTLYTSHTANESSRLYKTYKQQAMVIKILKSGLIEQIEQQTLPKCIILFGSIRKGEYDKKSDIDLFVQAPKQAVNLEKYEKNLKHRINILFEPEIKKTSKELLNNIANGIVLSGYLKLPE